MLFLGYSHVKGIASEKQLDGILKKKRKRKKIHSHHPPSHPISFPRAPPLLPSPINEQFGSNYVGQALKSGAESPARWMGGCAALHLGFVSHRRRRAAVWADLL